MGSVGWVGNPEGRSSKCGAGHVEPPANIGPKFKRDATCSSRGLRQPRILGLSGCNLKSKDAGGRNPGKSCAQEKEKKTTTKHRARGISR